MRKLRLLRKIAELWKAREDKSPKSVAILTILTIFQKLRKIAKIAEHWKAREGKFSKSVAIFVILTIFVKIAKYRKNHKTETSTKSVNEWR